MSSYYELLRIDRSADRDDIRRAFYKLAKLYHPDISKNSSTFLKILNAYKTLTDDIKREHYDSTLTRNRWLNGIVLSNKRVRYAVSLRDIALQRRFYRGSSRRGRYSSLNRKGYDVCVSLTREELSAGATVFIDVPAHVICPLCRGNHVHCTLCSDRGHILKAVPVPVHIPAAIRDDEVFTVPLRKRKGREFAYFMKKLLVVKIKIIQG